MSRRLAQPTYQIRPLYRREYERIVELGLFDDEKVELLGGSLFAMSPQGAAHALVTARLAALLIRALQDAAIVFTHSPLALGDKSEPEPDVAVVPPGDYVDRLPSRAWLVVEVSDSSLGKDRELKAGVYASARLPEYWIVNLAEDVIEVHRAPRGGRYTKQTRHGRGDVLEPLKLAKVRVPVADVLPPRRRRR